ncbi:hypothetical protein D1872_258700 [compost metagenome]
MSRASASRLRKWLWYIPAKDWAVCPGRSTGCTAPGFAADSIAIKCGRFWSTTGRPPTSISTPTKSRPSQRRGANSESSCLCSMTAGSVAATRITARSATGSRTAASCRAVWRIWPAGLKRPACNSAYGSSRRWSPRTAICTAATRIGACMFRIGAGRKLGTNSCSICRERMFGLISMSGLALFSPACRSLTSNGI